MRAWISAFSLPALTRALSEIGDEISTRPRRTRSLVTRVRDEETERIVEIVQAHADYDERGNRVLVDLIVDEICGGSGVRTPNPSPLDPDREL